MSVTFHVSEFRDAVSFYSSRFNVEGLIFLDEALASIGVPKDYLADPTAMIAWVEPDEGKSEEVEGAWQLRDADGNDIAVVGLDGAVRFAMRAD